MWKSLWQIISPLAWRVHVSMSTMTILYSLGGYLMVERGMVEMKVDVTFSFTHDKHGRLITRGVEHWMNQFLKGLEFTIRSYAQYIVQYTSWYTTGFLRFYSELCWIVWYLLRSGYNYRTITVWVCQEHKIVTTNLLYVTIMSTVPCVSQFHQIR